MLRLRLRLSRRLKHLHGLGLGLERVGFGLALLQLAAVRLVAQPLGTLLATLLGWTSANMPTQMRLLTYEAGEALAREVAAALAYATEVKANWDKIVQSRSHLTAARERTEERKKDAVRGHDRAARTSAVTARLCPRALHAGPRRRPRSGREQVRQAHVPGRELLRRARRERREEGVLVAARQRLQQPRRRRAARAVVRELHLVQEEVEDVPVALVVRDGAGAVGRGDLVARSPVGDLERLEAALLPQREQLGVGQRGARHLDELRRRWQRERRRRAARLDVGSKRRLERRMADGRRRRRRVDEQRGAVCIERKWRRRWFERSAGLQLRIDVLRK